MFNNYRNEVKTPEVEENEIVEFTKEEIEAENKERVIEKSSKRPSKSRKQILKERMERAKQKKAEEEEKLRKLLEEKKRKAKEEEEAMIRALKEIEAKENPILGKWVREAYEADFSTEAIETLKSKAIKLIEDGIKT